MLYPIQNFEGFVPYGAQYVGIMSEDNGVYSVEYFSDPSGQHKTFNQSIDGLVLTKQRLEGIIGDVFGDVARSVRGPGNQVPCTYLFHLKSDRVDSDTGVNVGEILTPLDENQTPVPYHKGDEIKVAPKVGAATLTYAVIDEYVGPGTMNDNMQALVERFGSPEEAMRAIESSPIDRIRPSETWTPSEHIPANEGAKFSAPLEKLKDTTKVSRQGKKTNRKGDRDPSEKDMDYDDYYAHGKDNRGAMRAPQSPGEQDFINRHTKDMMVVDYPGSGEWIGTVTNKDIDQKFQKFNEDIAPLSSESEESI